MKPKLKMVIAALFLLIAVLSCNLPTRNPDALTPSVSSMPDTIESDANRIEPDFSQVRLQLADLPQGFNPVDPKEMSIFGKDINSFLTSISASLAKAEPQNVAVFNLIDGVNSTLVISFIVQPLTLLERGAFDLLTRDPQRAVGLIANAVSDTTFNPLVDIEPVGDAVLGTAFNFDRAEIPTDGELILSRRGQVVQAAIVVSVRGGSRAVGGLEIAKIIDEKIQEALE